jgi:hypothetical protein
MSMKQKIRDIIFAYSGLISITIAIIVLIIIYLSITEGKI